MLQNTLAYYKGLTFVTKQALNFFSGNINEHIQKYQNSIKSYHHVDSNNVTKHTSLLEKFDFL